MAVTVPVRLCWSHAAPRDVEHVRDFGLLQSSVGIGGDQGKNGTRGIVLLLFFFGKAHRRFRVDLCLPPPHSNPMKCT
jgi:hypothetical protein